MQAIAPVILTKLFNIQYYASPKKYSQLGVLYASIITYTQIFFNTENTLLLT